VWPPLPTLVLNSSHKVQALIVFDRTLKNYREFVTLQEELETEWKRKQEERMSIGLPPESRDDMDQKRKNNPIHPALATFRYLVRATWDKESLMELNYNGQKRRNVEKTGLTPTDQDKVLAAAGILNIYNILLNKSSEIVIQSAIASYKLFILKA